MRLYNNKHNVWWRGYNRTAVSWIGPPALSDTVFLWPLPAKNIGKHDKSQCIGLYSSPDDALGTSAPGREQMPKIRFDRMGAAVFPARSSETNNGITGGYKIGAGSNEAGNDIGIHRDGCRSRYAQKTNRKG